MVPADRPGGLSLLLSPPCPGLGPRGTCLLAAASCLPTLLPVPSCSVLIVSIATGGVRYRIRLPGGTEAKPRGAAFAGCSGVSAGSISAAPLLPAGVEDILTSPTPQGRLCGLQGCSSTPPHLWASAWLGGQCQHSRVEEGRRRKGGERKSTEPRSSGLEYKPARGLWAGASLSSGLLQLAQAE